MSVFTQEIEYPRDRRLGRLATGRAAFVVDDVLPRWRPRIFPERIVGWGIYSDGFSRNARTVG